MVLSLLEEQEYKRYIEAFDFSKYMKIKLLDNRKQRNDRTGYGKVDFIPE